MTNITFKSQNSIKDKILDLDKSLSDKVTHIASKIQGNDD